MREVLISIQPKWCELIASGKKTIEVRKTRPKIDTPFKCYIYCTQGKTLDDILTFAEYENGEYMGDYYANGKVIGEFVCRNIYFLDESALFGGMDEISNSVIEEYSCLSIDDLLAYKGNKKEIYGWSISDLVFYEQPKELSEFINYDRCPYGGMVDCNKCGEHHCLKRPPQSWCYVQKGGAE